MQYERQTLILDHQADPSLVGLLEPLGHRCRVLRSPNEALAEPEDNTLVMLMRLPSGPIDPFSFLSAYRRQSARPVIAVCPPDDPEVGLRALEQGADDYVCRADGERMEGRGSRELLARIAASLRAESRYARERSGQLRLGDLALDLDASAALVRGEQISLTAREFSILRTLMQSEQRIPARALLDAVWGRYGNGQVHYVHVYVSRLRRTLADTESGVNLTHTRGQGYLLEPQAWLH